MFRKKSEIKSSTEERLLDDSNPDSIIKQVKNDIENVLAKMREINKKITITSEKMGALATALDNCEKNYGKLSSEYKKTEGDLKTAEIKYEQAKIDCVKEIKSAGLDKKLFRLKNELSELKNPKPYIPPNPIIKK